MIKSQLIFLQIIDNQSQTSKCLSSQFAMAKNVFLMSNFAIFKCFFLKRDILDVKLHTLIRCLSVKYKREK